MNPTTWIPVLAILAGALGAKSPQPVVIEGEMLPGGGTVTGIRFLHVEAIGH